MSPSHSNFDYIIVGGGTSGVPIASRLSTYLPTSSILLLEAGLDHTTHPSITNPINSFPGLSTIFQPPIGTIDHSTTPQPHCNNRRISNLAGRVLSGSSAINVGIWMRASKTDYALIAEKAGDERFGWEGMLPYFKRVETHWDKDADPKFHGFEGPIHTIGGRHFPLRSAVQASAEKLGQKYNPDATKGDPLGLVDVTQCFRATSESTSERQHSSRVYDLSKVTVMCEAAVAKILIDDEKRAVGVELLDGRTISAKEEVIVSCGTQKTPQLLMLSGIGAKEELQKHNIPLIADSPAVGQNLFDHSALTLYFGLRTPSDGLALPFTGTVRPDFSQGMPWEFNLFSNIPPSLLAPHLISDGLIPSRPLPSAEDELHPHLRERRCHYLTFPFYFPVLASPMYSPTIDPTLGTHIALSSIHLLPVSRGTVSLKSSDPTAPPVIDPKYLSTCTDRFIFRSAVRSMLLLAATPPFSDHLISETPPMPSLSNNHTVFPALSAASSDQDIDARIRDYKQTIAHPMGTCALGTVLDSEFRVKGVKGLRVCDASVFPEPLGAMPSCTIYALGELCADLIASR